MENKNHNIDSIFKDSFEDFADSPSAKTWEGLQDRLMAVQEKKEKRKKKRIFFFILFALSTFIVFGFYQKVFDFQAHDATTLANSNTQSSKSILLSPKEKISNTSNVANNLISSTASFSPGIVVEPEQEEEIFSKPLSSENPVEQTISGQLKGESTILITKEEDQFNFQKSKNANEEDLGIIDKLPLNELSLLESKTLIPITQKAPKSRGHFRNKLTVRTVLYNSRFNRKLRNNPSVLGNPAAFFDQHESTETAWSYGLTFGLKLNQKWRVESGVSLIHFQQKTQYTIPSVYNGDDPSTAILFTSFNTNDIQFQLSNAAGFESGDLITIEEDFKQQISWLSLPLLIGHRIEKGPWSLDLSAGIAANIFLGNQIELDSGPTGVRDFKHVHSESSARFHLAYRTEANILFQTSPRTKIFLGAHFQNALMAANQQKATLFYPSMLGWQLGVERRF